MDNISYISFSQRTVCVNKKTRTAHKPHFRGGGGCFYFEMFVDTFALTLYSFWLIFFLRPVIILRRHDTNVNEGT